METDQQDLLIEITSFLEENNIPYMVTGAWSVIYYGRPRASHDIDFVVEISPENIDKTLKKFASLSDDFDVQENLIRRAVRKRGMFNIIYRPSILKLDFWLLTDDLFDKERFQRKQKVAVLGQKMFFATAEDTILQKLRWYQISPSEKNLIDAAFVYQIQRKNLDLKYLAKWAKFLKVSKNFYQLGKINLENYI